MGLLAELVSGQLTGDPETWVSHATIDSRRVEPGSLFVAVPGRRSNGHLFVDEAEANGATALCVSEPVTSTLPILRVSATRAVLPRLAAEIYDHPSRTLEVIGVTGTNGKTTVTFLLEAIATAAGRSCGLIGTVDTRLGAKRLVNPHTTPEATDFQRLLAEMADGGADWVATEVSSHALALDRVAETSFAIGAFTNLSQDHLDLHGGMEAYFQAKAKLLDMAQAQVIWAEDHYGTRLAEAHPDGLLVGWNHPASATEVRPDQEGTQFRLRLPDGEADARVNLPGLFNLANALVAAACAHLAGIDVDAIAAGIASLRAVPGRFELVSGSAGVKVVVDYAHTPEGIATVVDTARTLARGRVIVIVGAGGERDQGKRPQMGRAAATADLVIVTSDNPRSEDPGQIIDEVMSGVDNSAVMAIVERREAIATALAAAASGDIVLILGKGHETTQEISGVMYPFSDQEVAREHLARLAAEPEQ